MPRSKKTQQSQAQKYATFLLSILPIEAKITASKGSPRRFSETPRSHSTWTNAKWTHSPSHWPVQRGRKAWPCPQKINAWVIWWSEIASRLQELSGLQTSLYGEIELWSHPRGGVGSKGRGDRRELKKTAIRRNFFRRRARPCNDLHRRIRYETVQCILSK